MPPEAEITSATEAIPSGITPGIAKMAEAFERGIANARNPDAAKVVAATDAKTDDTPVPDAAAAAKEQKTINPLGDDLPASIRSSRAAEDFRAIKRRAAEAEAKIAEMTKAHNDAIAATKNEYESKLKAVPKIDAREYDSIKAEHQKFKDIVERISVEFDPAFQEKYQKRTEAVVSNLKSAVGDEDRAMKLAALLALPESQFKQKQIAEIADDLNSFQIAEIVQANRDLRAINEERNAELSKSREKFAELQQGKQEQLAKNQEQLAKVFESAISRAQDREKGMFLFQVKEGDTKDVADWNNAVNERLALAKHIFSGKFASEDERADAAFWAASAQPLLQDAIATKKELSEVKAQLAKIAGASPEVQAGATSDGKAQKPRSFSQTVSEGLRGIRS